MSMESNATSFRKQDWAAIMANQRGSGDDLIEEVRATSGVLSKLLKHENLLGPDTSEVIRSTCADVERRLSRQGLSVVVVGEKKVGKSTFLNALLGERILGTAVRECTGTVTQIRWAARFNYRAKFEDGHLEEFSRKNPDREPKLLERIRNEEKNVSDAETVLAAAEPKVAGSFAAMGLAIGTAEASRQAKLAAEQSQESSQRAGAEAAEELALATTAAQATAAALPRYLVERPRWWQILAWFMRLVFGFRWRAQEMAHRPNVEREVEAREHFAHQAKLSGVATMKFQEASQHLQASSAELEKARQAHLEAQAAQRDAASRLDATRAALAGARGSLNEHLVERHRAFLEEMRSLTDMQLRGEKVQELVLEYPAQYLPKELTIIDTPGVNTDNERNRDRSWEVIKNQADGCILLSDLQQVVGTSTRDFVSEVRGYVPHILLVLTKVDKALENAEGSQEDPVQQVEEARRVGVRRFAKQIGREPESILSIAVAAGPVIGDDPLGQSAWGPRFQAEIDKLFELLRRERSLIVGARTASGLRRCCTAINDAETRAEASYRERIRELEAQRIPDPARFRKRQMDQIEADILRDAHEITTSGRACLKQEMGASRKRLFARIANCSTKDELKTLAAGLETTVCTDVNGFFGRVQQHLSVKAGAASTKLESPLLQELRSRYKIAQTIASSSGAMLQRSGAAGEVSGPTISVNTGVGATVDSFENEQIGLGIGGAAGGALIGTLILPGIGTAIGAALGALIAFFKTLDDLKKECTTKLGTSLDTIESSLDGQLASSERTVSTALRGSLDEALAQALKNFERWISNLMEAERKAIENERSNLQNLLNVRDELQRHEDRLEAKMKLATAESLGLCGC